MNTPVGKEERLVKAGIRLPAMVDAGLVTAGPEEIDSTIVENMYADDSKHKIFGEKSNIELRREPGFEWYWPGFVKITFACFALIGTTWLVTRILFVW